jgi:hypothetical protein
VRQSGDVKRWLDSKGENMQRLDSFVEIRHRNRGRLRYTVISNIRGIGHSQRFSSAKQARRAAYWAAGWSAELAGSLKLLS